MIFDDLLFMFPNDPGLIGVSEERNFPGRPPVRWSHLLKNLRKSLSHLITCHSLSNNFRCKNHSLPLTAGSTLAHRSAAQRSPPCLPKLRRLTWPRPGKIFKLTWSFLVNSAPRINGNRVKKMVFQAVNHFGWDLLGISWLFKE